jgi:hypothetical protein
MYWDNWFFQNNGVHNVPASELWWITQPQWYPQPNQYVTTREELTGDYGCDEVALEAKLVHVRDGQTATANGGNGGGTTDLATLEVYQPLAPGSYQVVAA